MTHPTARMLRMIERAKGRCPELAKIEIIRPRHHPFTVERLNAHTIAYDPAAIAMLNESELIEAIVKAANEWACTPEAPELLSVTEQRDALKALAEAMIADLVEDRRSDTPFGFRERLDAIMGR